MKNKILLSMILILGVAGAFVVMRGLPVGGSKSPASVSVVTLSVKGMTCESCVATLTKGLSSVPGVAHVVVVLSDETARVSYDATKVTVKSLVETVEKLGYQSEMPAENQLNVVDFKVKIN